MVIHFSHDTEPEIEFPDLESFKRGVIAALEQGLDIDELPREPIAPHDDQPGVVRALTDLMSRDDDDAEFLLCLFIALLGPDQTSVIERLAVQESFFVRERLAKFIAGHPHARHRSVAQQLADDRYPQVARAGKAALSRVIAVPSAKIPDS
jgi:hypothetical protein